MKPSFSIVMAYIGVILPKTKAVYYSFAYSCAFIFFFILFIRDANSTTVITIRTPSEIIIGADSFLGNDKREVSGTICKIRQAGDVFFAPTGTPIAQGEGIDFNVYEIAAEVFSRNDPIQERIEAYDNIVKYNLKKIANLIRHDKERVESFFKYEDLVFISMVLAINTPDFPIMYKIEHTVISPVQEPARIKTTINRFTNRLKANEMDVLWTDKEKESCVQMFDKIMASDLADIIRKCIELQSKERPEFIRLPVDILSITRTGVKWIQHKKECPEIINQAK